MEEKNFLSNHRRKTAHSGEFFLISIVKMRCTDKSTPVVDILVQSWVYEKMWSQIRYNWYNVEKLYEIEYKKLHWRIWFGL